MNGQRANRSARTRRPPGQLCRKGNHFLCYVIVLIHSPTISASDDVVDLAGATDDLDRLRLVLLRLARRIRTKAVGSITPSQVAVLATVSRRGPCTLGQIAEFEHVRPPSVSKIVAALEHLELVERRTDPADRRCAVIQSSTAGEAYLDEVRAEGRSWLASQLAELDEPDIDAIATAVPALERLLGANA